MSVTDTAPGRRHAPSHPLLLSGFALVSGMTAWLVHLVGASILVPASCEHGVLWSIHGLTVVTVAVCVLGLWAGRRIQRWAGNGDDPIGEGWRLLALVSLGANGLSLLLIVAEGAMALFVGVCR